MKLIKLFSLITGVIFFLLLLVLHYKYYSYFHINRIYWLTATVLSFFEFVAVTLFYLFLEQGNKFNIKLSLKRRAKDIYLGGILLLRKFLHSK